MNIQTFNIEAFNDIVKNIRNSHRTATDERFDTAFLTKEKAKLQKAISDAAQVADMETVGAKSAELRRVLARLEDGPQEAIDKFDTAIVELNELLNPQPVAVVEEKEAA